MTTQVQRCDRCGEFVHRQHGELHCFRCDRELDTYRPPAAVSPGTWWLIALGVLWAVLATLPPGCRLDTHPHPRIDAGDAS
jgi:hypothetical protein